MEAPDKIYIDDLAVVNDCVTKISTTHLPNFSEYIRKDTLLEKLNRARELRIKAGAKEQSEGIRVIDALTNIINGL